MNGVCPGISHNIRWGLDRIAGLNFSVSLARNMVITAISGIVVLENLLPLLAKIPQEFQKYAPLKSISDKAAPALSHYKFKLVTVKDFSSMLIFIVTAAELSNPDFWTNSKNSFARKASKTCKLVYSGLETFLLVPDKWNWIDLGRWCNSVGSMTGLGAITATNIFILKELFVLGSAGFGIWYSTQEIEKAQAANDKNLDRKAKLEKLHSTLDSVQGKSSFAEVEKLAKDYLEGKNKRPALIKSYEKILDLHKQDNTQDPEKKNKELLKNEEKVRRIAYFAARYNDEPILEECRKSVINKILRKTLKACLHEIEDEHIQRRIADLLSERPASLDILNRIEAMMDDVGDYDFLILEPVLENARKSKNTLEQVAPYTKSPLSMARIEHILDYKIKKAGKNIEINNSQETKFRISRWFDIAKIAFVALGLLVVAGLTLTYLAGFAAAIAAGSAISGIAIGILGLAKMIYDLFYWKHPKSVAYPSTNLA